MLTSDQPISPRRQRADARLHLSVARVGGRTRVVRLAEAGSARLRLPRVVGDPVEAVTINTGGGITGGDRFDTEIEVGSAADLVVTSAAAEKIYRSEDATAQVSTAIRVEADGRIDWLPQETILFDRSRVARSLEVDLAPSASAHLFEAIVFGRAASGETLQDATCTDRWRVRRAGRLVYADTLRLSGDVAAQLARPAIAGGGRALATFIHVAADAESRTEDARAALEGARSECGASAWDGLLVARFLAPDVETLRHDAMRFMTLFRGRPMPRVWTL